MIATRTHTVHLNNIELTALSSTEWRVFDDRNDPHDALGLLGFVQKSGNGYETLRFSAPGGVAVFPSLLEAARSFAR